MSNWCESVVEREQAPEVSENNVHEDIKPVIPAGHSIYSCEIADAVQHNRR